MKDIYSELELQNLKQRIEELKGIPITEIDVVKLIDTSLYFWKNVGQDITK